MKTIKELYEWAIEHHVENLTVELQYQDGGGAYYGDTFTEYGCDIIASIRQSESVQYYILLE